jgi:hypothetical protein
MNQTIAAFAFTVAFAGTVFAQPRQILKEKGKMTDAEVQKAAAGQVVTRVLPSSDNLGVLVVGAVYVNGPIEKFAAEFRNVQKLKENKVYLDVQEFSQGGTPAKITDFLRLNLGKKDIDELQSCKPGDCDLQVFDDLEAFQKKVDWNAPNKYALANAFLRARVVDGLNTYMSGGLRGLGSYRDRSKPLNLYDATKAMVDASYYLPQDRALGIYKHVVDYPNGKLAGAEDFFYWEVIDFGQGPTVRINHVSIFPKGFGASKLNISNKQLYASRYMRAALQMFYCMPDTDNPGKPGFFLIEVNDSRLPDFGSIKLAIVRKIATSKAQEATADTLTMFASRLNGK